MNQEAIRSRVAEIQWFHNYEVVPGIMTNGVSDMQKRGAYFEIPQDLSGKRLLDIGAADGYFSFLAESRGAEVVSIDSWPRRGYFLAHELRQSKAEFHHMSVYDINPDKLGMFDIVFFFGVYYHLKHPILALERIANVTREYAIIESEVIPVSEEQKGKGRSALFNKSGKTTPEAPISRFYEQDALGSDPTNWWAPNLLCFEQTIRAAGFPRAELVTYYDGRRGIVRASKGPRTAGKILNEDLFVVIDTPGVNEKVNGTVHISGWAVSQLDPEEGIDQITLYLDKLDDPAAELGQAERGILRGDQTLHFGDEYAHCGYQFTWNAGDVTPGEHTLYVLVEGKGGWHYRSRQFVVK